MNEYFSFYLSTSINDAALFEDKIVIFELDETIYVLSESDNEISISFGENAQLDFINYLIDLATEYQIELLSNNISYRYFEDYAEDLTEAETKKLKVFFKGE